MVVLLRLLLLPVGGLQPPVVLLLLLLPVGGLQPPVVLRGRVPAQYHPGGMQFAASYM